jgi:hypothetical protein
MSSIKITALRLNDIAKNLFFIEFIPGGRKWEVFNVCEQRTHCNNQTLTRVLLLAPKLASYVTLYRTSGDIGTVPFPHRPGFVSTVAVAC